MKIYDISQELTMCKVYPGDPKPEVKKISSIESNDLYNLSSIFMCAHNGTHVDAPSHFISDGKTIEKIELDYFVGLCYVHFFDGLMSRNDALLIIEKAKQHKANERILIKGNCVITEEAAMVFADEKIKLIGNESQSVGPVDAPMQVHLILLERNIVLLEGIVLDNVDEGVYYLCAQPLKIKGIEGAPCRAILISLD